MIEFGTNEMLFLGLAIFLFTANLIAFRMGRGYVLAMIAISTVLMNIAVTKQYDLLGFAATGGNALYGATFLLTDLLNERYGKKAAFEGVMVGFGAMLMFVVVTQFLLAFEAGEYDEAQSSMETLFSPVPRILLGSMIAYLIAQLMDVHIFHKLKEMTKDKHLWLRNLCSTIPAQFLDAVIFTLVGLTTINLFGNQIEGIIPMDIFWEVTLITFTIKAIVALLDTPFIYLARYCTPKTAQS